MRAHAFHNHFYSDPHINTRSGIEDKKGIIPEVPIAGFIFLKKIIVLHRIDVLRFDFLNIMSPDIFYTGSKSVNVDFLIGHSLDPPTQC
jgi:hypothetical protein